MASNIRNESNKNEETMIEAMSLCHSISMMKSGKLVGDPLDIEMF